MKRIRLVLLLLLAFSVSARANTAKEMAKATLKAHGGENLTKMQTLVLRGSGTVTSPGSVQTIPVNFVIVLANERYRFDLNGIPVFNFKQIFNGTVSSTSMDGVNVAPVNLVGLPVLAKIEAEGVVISELPEKLKAKKKGFRVTSPEGFYTDFIIDEKTSLVKEYSGKYEVNGIGGHTAVSIEKYREVEGVMIHEKYSQKIETGQFSSYGEFTAKEILVNTAVSDDVFEM
jgi:hypothetical protein